MRIASYGLLCRNRERLRRMLTGVVGERYSGRAVLSTKRDGADFVDADAGVDAETRCPNWTPTQVGGRDCKRSQAMLEPRRKQEAVGRAALMMVKIARSCRKRRRRRQSDFCNPKRSMDPGAELDEALAEDSTDLTGRLTD